MANWAVRTQNTARRMWELGFSPVLLSSRLGVVANNAISPPTTTISSIRSATANRRLLALQHHHEEREESALAPKPEPERSTYPVLMVPRPDSQMEAEDDDEYYHYFHLADLEEIQKREIEEEEREARKVQKVGVRNYDCVGSSLGWLAFLDPNNFSIYFVNPLIHSDDIRQCFRLPPIPANNLEGGGGGVPFIQKVALSSPPYGDSYTAAAIYGPGRDLAFYEPKDGTWWTPGGVGDYSDVIYSKKDGFFYTIRNPQANYKPTDTPIQAWDPFSRQSTLIHPSFDKPQFHFLSGPVCIPEDHIRRHVDEKRYLVESSPSGGGGGGGGDLYLLLRYICKCMDKDHVFYPPLEHHFDLDPFITYKTFLFYGYKLNRDNDGISYWVEEDGSSGQCFFVGMNHSFSVPVSETDPVLREDCVYYSDDCFDKMHLVSNSGGHDNGFGYISLKSRVIYNNDLSKYKPPPIWLDVLSQP